MKEIISKDNKLLKEWAKLKQKKYIERTNLVLLEGMNLVKDAQSRGVEFVAVCVNAEIDINFESPVYRLSEQAFQVLSGTQHSQGIIAVAKMPEHKFEEPKKNFLVLDNINDPGNLGTIIRTAVACDFTQIFCFNCVDYRNEKVLRATMGTVFDCSVVPVTLEQLKQLKSYKLFCADMSGKNIFQIEKPKQPFGIVMGNEARGISPEVIELCSNKIALPMGNNVESLNVAVACGILMYLLGGEKI